MVPVSKVEKRDWDAGDAALGRVQTNWAAYV